MKRFNSFLAAFCISLLMAVTAFAQTPDTLTPEKKARWLFGRIRDNTVRAITPADFRNAFNAVANMAVKRAPYLTIAELRAGKADTSRVVQLIDKGKAGTFVYNPSSVAVDDSATVIKVGTRTYERDIQQAVNILWLGAVADGTTDNTAAFRKAVKFKNVYIPAGNYRINGTVTLANSIQRMSGEGTLIMGSNADMFARTYTPVFTNVDTVLNALTDQELSAKVAGNYTDIDTKAVVAGHTFTTGQTVVVRGDLAQDFFSDIKKVSGDTITFSEKLTFTLGANRKIALIPSNPLIIEGLTFKYLAGLTTTTGSDIFSLGKTRGVQIRNCIFDGTGIDGGISISGVGNVVYGCTFTGYRSAILLYDAGQNLIEKNRVTQSGSAIRAVRCHNLNIVDNYITNGSNQTHGIGIELTAESGTYSKNCFNKIRGNTIINANHGVIGSGIGGIHLNFSANHNVIEGNISKKNTFGIYLENNCDYNIISNNECSYNDGYYGVGIELDWNNDNNTITGNNCSYNVGSLNANESSGIQIRSADPAHIQYGNTVSGNTCSYNGKEGIRAIGRNLTISGNTIRGNGVSKGITTRRGLFITGENITVSGNSIYDDSFDPGSTANFKGYALAMLNASGVNITGNTIYASYYSKGGIYYEADTATAYLNGVVISGNVIKAATAGGRAINILKRGGYSGQRT